MIVIIPTHNQAASLVRSIEGYLNQSKNPEHVVVVIDRCEDNTREVAERFIEAFVEKGIGYHIIDTDASVSGFGAGFTRDCGLKYARILGNGPFLFTDGDCIPSVFLVEEHSRALAGQQGAAVCCGLRHETGVTIPDSKMVEIGPNLYDDIRNFADHLKGKVTGEEDRLVINPEVMRSSWICWSCNVSINAAAVDLCLETNEVLSGSTDRVFNPMFDGKWGGEDGFLGLTIFRRGGRVIMLSWRSSVAHQWHDRSHTQDDHLQLVDAMDYALSKALAAKVLEAPTTEIIFDRQPFTTNIEEVASFVVDSVLPPHLQEVADLFPKDSLFLSVFPLFTSTNFKCVIDATKPSLLSKAGEVKTYINRCVEILRKADVIVAPDGKLFLNRESNIDVSKA